MLFRSIVLTQSSSTRATETDLLFEKAVAVFGEDRVSTASDLATALTMAKSKVSADGMVVISGSITLVGDALKLKQQEEANG